MSIRIRLRKPRVLELFSGTGSVGKVCRQRGWDVVSLDILPNHQPTHVIDILKWDYTKWDPSRFDIIWASPPCTEYSAMRNIHKKPRDLILANAIVQRTLNIITYFQPRHWFIENPQSGLLKDLPFMALLRFDDVDYCQYGYPFRKRTRIWHSPNVDLKLRLCTYDCARSDPVKRRHLSQMGQNRLAKRDEHCVRLDLDGRHAIPAPLIENIMDQLPYHHFAPSA